MGFPVDVTMYLCTVLCKVCVCTNMCFKHHCCLREEEKRSCTDDIGLFELDLCTSEVSPNLVFVFGS